MITPNLASRPFLNTRPVWLVTAAAALLALVLILLDLRLLLVSNRVLGAEVAIRDELERRHSELVAAVRADVNALNRVPWRSLEARVKATNLVLREQAFSWLRMLDDIEGVMPYDVRLVTITPSVGADSVMLSFEVVSRNREAMLQLRETHIAAREAALKDLHAVLTPEQKALADQRLRGPYGQGMAMRGAAR